MEFYTNSISAPCRAAMLTAKAAGVTLNKKNIDLMNGEQMKPDFVAINPQHCVPTLVDGDFVLWESRVVCTYLASKYGPESLYPKDVRTRAEIDRLLYFDMGTLYHRFGNYVYPAMFRGEKADPANLVKLQEALGFLEGYLDGHDFAVGNTITVADHSLAASVSSFEAAGINLSQHTNVVAWLQRCKNKMPGYDTENAGGAKSFGDFAKSKLN